LPSHRPCARSPLSCPQHRRRPRRASRAAPRPNKLFFGTFAAMDEDEWTESVLADLRADETVFRTMLHDMYQNGQVLQHKKYRWLGYAYRLFMAGLVRDGGGVRCTEIPCRPRVSRQTSLPSQPS